MSSDLRTIKTLPSLIAYLRDELEWPIDSDDVEEISYTYAPEELGLTTEHAVKINQIRQIRPLHSKQPWGIFWVSFEKKRLPVVVLRRILGSLVIKSRQSANNADRPRWKMQDILFVSAYGEETSEQREISFAHFSQADGDLPTLKVLGWDGADTTLKLADVEQTLSTKLRWPAKPDDAEAWRQQWNSAFRHKLGHVIRTSDQLAETLAALARDIRDAAGKLLEAESDRGPLTKLFKAFQAALIHDLTAESFADTYAQTITYGLFTAAVNRTDLSGGTEATFVKADDMTLMARSTSPFLKEMLETFLHVGGRKNGVDFDELGIQDVVELLRGDETDLPAILRDFGNRTRGEDPVIHFYEHFLSAYNKKLKIQRGVFYTPQPVVSYIVRSVHELLQTEFGLADGLASTVTWGEMLQRQPGLKLPDTSDDPKKPQPIKASEPFVQILDPATGTATFLVETVDVIFKHLQAKWKTGGAAAMPRLSTINSQPSTFLAYWNAYVPEHLLPRLHGYELLAAPYAIAHLKLGLKLTETGYRFGSDERARIYLTNALEPKVAQLPQIGFEPLAHEAKAVNEIKWYKRFTVVIGNPPYSNYGQMNKIPFILNLLEDYKRGLDEKKINLDDDFIKFVRYSQHLLDSTGRGVFGMITNNSFLDGVTHRQMRHSIGTSYQSISILNLHGSANLGETCPDGSPDENVFDIRQGVGVTLCVKSTSESKNAPSLQYDDLWGLRANKYTALAQRFVGQKQTSSLSFEPPYFFFVPKDFSSNDEYECCVPLTEILVEQNTGIQTKRDELFIDLEKERLAARFQDIAKHSRDGAYLKRTYDLEDSSGWSVSKLAGLKYNSDAVVRVLYRPFDIRWLYFDANALGRARESTMRHMVAGKNLGIITLRINGEGKDFVCLATNHIIEKGSLPRGNYSLFPLFLYDETLSFDLGMRDVGSAHSKSSRPNFASAFTKKLAAALKLPQTKPHGLPDGVTPEDIFHYAYGVFHSPGYRSRYAEFLKIDFPRLPLTGNLELFRALARLGGELTALHLLESPKLDHPITEHLGGRAPEVEKVSWSKNTVWLDKAQTTGFKGVREDVWNFHIGGYQVCEKWLKDRKGRNLSAADRAHYKKIIIALSETIRLMAEIDAVITKHGGWPLK